MTRLRLIIAAFVVGLAAGGGITALITAHRVETLTLARDSARLDLAAKSAELRRIEAELAKGHPTESVRTVTVRVTGVGGRAAIEIEKAVQDVLSAVPGMAISRIDPALFHDVLSGRLVSADGNLYRLELTTAVIAPECLVTVRALSVSE